MFKSKTINLTITEDSIRLEDSESLIFKQNIVGNPIENGELVDSKSFSYQFLKTLSKIKERARINIILDLPNIVFRNKLVPNLKENEVVDYLDYNLQDIILYGIEKYKFDYIYSESRLFLFGINRILYETIEKVLYEESLKNFKIASFPYLIVKQFFDKKKNNNTNHFKLENNILEFVNIVDVNKIKYISIPLEYPLNEKNLDLSIPENRLKLASIRKAIDLVVKSGEDIENFDTYLYGDKNIINVWKKELEKIFFKIKDENNLFYIEPYKLRDKFSLLANNKSISGKRFLKLPTVIIYLLIILILFGTIGFDYFNLRQRKNIALKNLSSQNLDSIKVNDNIEIVEKELINEKLFVEFLDDLNIKSFNQKKLMDFIILIENMQTSELYLTDLYFEDQVLELGGHSSEISLVEAFIEKLNLEGYSVDLNEIEAKNQYFIFSLKVGERYD